jgi:hypothetical protein
LFPATKDGGTERFKPIEDTGWDAYLINAVIIKIDDSHVVALSPNGPGYSVTFNCFQILKELKQVLAG